MPPIHKIFNLHHLRAFVAVVAHNSISKASIAVHLSQPAISQALNKLEKILDTQLFIRKSNGIYPSEPGAVFFNRVERALNYVKTGSDLAIEVDSRNNTRGFTQFENLLSCTHLRILTAVSEFGNFSMVARGIGMSQPSISTMAKDMEAFSGIALFNRTSQGIQLTDPARELMRFAGLALAELELGIQEINMWRRQEVVKITIGTLPLVRTSILPKGLHEFTTSYPEIQIRVVDGPYNNLLYRLRHGDLDFIIGALRDPLPINDVVQEELFQDKLTIVAQDGHQLTNRKNISIDDLTEYPWVIPVSGTPTRQHFDEFFNNANVSPPKRFIESGSLTLIQHLLKESGYLSMISRHQVQHLINSGELKCLNFNFDHTQRPIGITNRHDWLPTVSHTRFLNILRKISL